MENINFEDEEPLEMGEMSLQEDEISRVQPHLDEEEEEEFSPSDQEQQRQEEIS